MRTFALLLTVCIVAVAATAQTTIVQTNTGGDGWRGFWNNGPGGRPSDWGDGDGNCNAGVAGFDRTEIQNAINAAIAAQGDWDAYLVVTHPSWGAGAMGSLDPVAGVFDVDAVGYLTGTMAQHQNGAGGGWTADAGAVTGNFEPVVTGGSGSMVELNPGVSFRPAGVTPTDEEAVIDITEALVNHYLTNTAAEGFFVSGAQETEYQIYGNNQWGGIGDMRLEIVAVPEPATMSLLGLGALALIRRRK